jgi:hypothetical protein
MAPSDLHLPQFTYSTPTAPVDLGSPAQPQNPPSMNESYTQPFAFSALFQSSKGSSPGLSALHSTPSQRLTRSAMREQVVASFIGFSWGPKKDAFPSPESCRPSPPNIGTPKPLGHRSTQSTPLHRPLYSADTYPYATPRRPAPHTLPRTSTVCRRGTAQRRVVSDREAMKQLVDCVGMSARKKVLESGRKPRVLTLPLSRSRSSSGVKKDVRFGPPPPQPNIAFGEDGGDDSSRGVAGGVVDYLAGSDYSESEGPPSPSPSPRPGSALSRRSATPTITASHSQPLGNTVTSSNNTSWVDPPTMMYQANRDVTSRNVRLSSDRPFTTGALDALGSKHASIMEDIEDIEQRLDYLALEMGSR